MVMFHFVVAEYYPCVCVCVRHIFLSQCSTDRLVGCFQVLVILNSADMNIGVHVSFKVRVFAFFQIYFHEWDG